MSLGRRYRSRRSKVRRQDRTRHPDDPDQQKVEVIQDKVLDWQDLDRELYGYATYLDDKVQQLVAVSSGGDWKDFASDICSGGEMTVILGAIHVALGVIEREPGPSQAERRVFALARRVLFTGSMIVSLVEGFSPTAVLIALGFKALDFYLAQQIHKLEGQMHESLELTRETRKQIRKIVERLSRQIERM